MLRNVVFAVATLAFAHAADAQRPIVTQDVDEPGRSPYQSYAAVSCSDNCIVDFAPVPSGKRLVVTYLSVFGVGKTRRTTLLGLDDPSGAPIDFFLGTDPETGFRTFHEPVTLYVGPGITPRMYSIGGTELRGTLVGYLVSVP